MRADTACTEDPFLAWLFLRRLALKGSHHELHVTVMEIHCPARGFEPILLFDGIHSPDMANSVCICLVLPAHHLLAAFHLSSGSDDPGPLEFQKEASNFLRSSDCSRHEAAIPESLAPSALCSRAASHLVNGKSDGVERQEAVFLIGEKQLPCR